MTTATLPKSVADRITQTAMAEHQRWQAEERKTALAELAKVEAEWTSAMVPLDEKILEAETELELLEAELQKAQSALREAHAEKRRHAFGFDQRREALRNRLTTGDLCDHRISEALDSLTKLEEEARQIPLGDVNVGSAEKPIFHSQFPQADQDRELLRAITARLDWIKNTGRPAIAELRLTNPADIDAEIETILAGLPAI